MTRPCTGDLYRSPAKPQLNPLAHFFPHTDMGITTYIFILSKYKVNFKKQSSQPIWSVELFDTRRINEPLLCK